MTSKRQEPHGETHGKAVPPYEGRRTSGRVKDEGETAKGRPRTGGATGPVKDRAMKASDPEDTPGGRTGSPASEEPAAEARRSGRPDDGTDKGTGPAHQHGVRRAEDQG